MSSTHTHTHTHTHHCFTPLVPILLLLSSPSVSSSSCLTAYTHIQYTLPNVRTHMCARTHTHTLRRMNLECVGVCLRGSLTPSHRGVCVCVCVCVCVSPGSLTRSSH